MNEYYNFELSQRNTGRVIHIIKKYMKVKGDMLVMENISRKKNYRDFEVLEKFLNEQRFRGIKNTYE